MCVWFLVNFWNFCSSSTKYAIGILTGIALTLQIALGSMDIFMMLNLPTMNMEYASTNLYLLQFLSSVSYNFPGTGLSHPWLNLFLGIFFFGVIVNEIVFLVSLFASLLLIYKMQLISEY